MFLGTVNEPPAPVGSPSRAEGWSLFPGEQGLSVWRGQRLWGLRFLGARVTESGDVPPVTKPPLQGPGSKPELSLVALGGVTEILSDAGQE